MAKVAIPPTEAARIYGSAAHVLERTSVKFAKDGTTWRRITKLANDFLPRACMLHPWPQERFAVKNPITVPPRHLKSITASVAFPAFVLGHDPTKKFVCLSYSGDLAVKHAAEVGSQRPSAARSPAVEATSLSLMTP
jgi:hypothetical protein